MFNLLRNAALVAGIATLSACSSTPDVAKQVKAFEEQRQEQIAETIEREQAQRELELKALPDWFLEPPTADGTGFFGVGYAKSKHIGHGLKSAVLQAEFNLAKVYRQELSGSERAFEQGNSDGDVTSETTFLIDKLIDAVPIVGYDIVDQKVEPIGGVFEFYVLLKLPYDEFNKVLQSERQKDTSKKVQLAFDDLERRLTQRRVEKAKEKQADHEREIEALKARNDILVEQTQTVSDQPVRPKVEHP